MKEVISLKKIFKGLTALAICGALNFGLTTDAQATEIDPLIDLSGIESQEMARHPSYRPPPPPPDYESPPRKDRWRHSVPHPPHYRGGYWDEPPPPPSHRPPPPPPHRW